MDNVGIRTIVVNFEDEQLPYLSLVQGDAKTRGFDIVICDSDGKEIPPSDDYIVELVATGSNAPDTPYANRHTIKDGKYRVMIPTEALSKSGFVFLQLVFYQKSTGAVIHTIEQKCPVYRSRGQEVVESNNLYVDITALRLALEDEETRKSNEETRQSQESTRQSQEADRVSAENSRVEVENTRKLNEENRVSAEGSRVEVESVRVTAEEQRKSNEAQRIADEKIRLEQELTRQSEEATRKSAEEQRIADEKTRQSQETTRKSQETARESAEEKRVSSETTRASEEEVRKSNEIERADSENIRQSQESERVTAEKERETIFDSWDKTMEGVLPNATDTEKGAVKISSLESESEPYTAVSIGKFEDTIAPFLFNSNIPFNEIVDNKFYMEIYGHNIRKMVEIEDDEEKMNTLLQSKYVKTLQEGETVEGKFLILKGECQIWGDDFEDEYFVNIIGQEMLGYDNLIVSKIYNEFGFNTVYYYDLG